MRVVVVGQGPAGLLTADWAHRLGAEVFVAAAADGSLALWSGAWDFRSFADSGEVVRDPWQWWDLHGRQRGVAWNREDWVRWWTRWRDTWSAAGIPLAAGAELPSHNRWTPTAVGRLRPVFVCPAWQWAADEPEPVIWVGLEGLADTPIALASARYHALTGMTATGVCLPRPDAWVPHWSGLAWSVYVDSEPGRQWLTEALTRALRDHAGTSPVLMPQMLGQDGCETLIGQLEAALGRPVREYALLPPAVGGIRIRDRWKRALKRRGVTWVSGTVGAVRKEGVQFRDTGELLPADAVVLATGGILGGGLWLSAAGELFNTGTGEMVPWSGRMEDLARAGIGTEGPAYRAVGRVVGGFDSDRDGDSGAVNLYTVASAMEALFGERTAGEGWQHSEEGP